MKIILAHNKYFVQGGPERYMFNFIELAEKNGHTVIPFSVDYNRNVDTPYKKYFIKAVDKNSTGTFDVSKLTFGAKIKGIKNLFFNDESYNKLKRLIDIEKPDLLYVLIPGALTAAIFKAAKESCVPIILRLSDFRLICGNNILLREEKICEECIKGNYKCMIKHRCVKGSMFLSALRMLSLTYTRKSKAYDAVNAIISPPKFTADKFIESGFFPPEKLYVNSSFIDCSNTSISKVNKDYVLCLGRFSPEKGFIYVIEALQYLKDIPVKVAVTGDKENCPQNLREIIENKGLEDKVKFVGFLKGEKLKEIIAESLCVAAPAIWYENQPNVVIEAYSHGKPVIASNLGSLAEIVEDKKTGLLFEPKNSKQIADCIRTLYEDPEFCAELGQNARMKCEREFNPDSHWNRFISIYNKINNI